MVVCRWWSVGGGDGELLMECAAIRAYCNSVILSWVENQRFRFQALSFSYDCADTK